MTWPEGGDHSIVEIPIEKPVTEDDANE